MAKEKKLTEAEERENRRVTQLEILTSPAIQKIYAAAADNLDDNVPGKGDFGKGGANATYDHGYKKVLKDQADLSKKIDVPFARLQALQASLAEEEAGERMSATYTPKNLFRASIPFYVNAINQVKVGDMLGIIGSKTYKDLSKQDLNTYMSDFAKTNEDYYKAIVSEYLSYVVEIETGEAIIAAGKNRPGNLEKKLSEKTDKAEEERKAAAEKAKASK